MSREDFDKVVKKFNDFYSEDSEARIVLGLDTGLDDFSNPTVEQQEYDLKRAKRIRREFRNCPKRGLTFDQKLDLELGELALDQDIFSSTYTYNDKTWSSNGAADNKVIFFVPTSAL